MKVSEFKRILEQFVDDDEILIQNRENGKVKNLVSWTRGNTELILEYSDD